MHETIPMAKPFADMSLNMVQRTLNICSYVVELSAAHPKYLQLCR
jgi:hypothetical protein